MKTIIITGANGNLGTVVTKHFLDQGFQVVATVSEEAKKEFISHPHLQVESVDLLDETAASALVHNAVADYGQVHGALLLVGGFIGGDLNTATGTDLSKQFSLNFNSAYFVTRPLFEHMKKYKEGNIIFMGARPALAPSYAKDLVAYSLSKSLLFKLAEIINEEAKGTNITATVIAPSTIDTPLNRKLMPEVNPDNWVKPEHLAQIMEFVVSEGGSAMRETVLKVYNNS
ncbi:MAG: SDR family NAD(P)-dependent oxidoreductase [Flavitalea sp.]